MPWNSFKKSRISAVVVSSNHRVACLHVKRPESSYHLFISLTVGPYRCNAIHHWRAWSFQLIYDTTYWHEIHFTSLIGSTEQFRLSLSSFSFFLRSQREIITCCSLLEWFNSHTETLSLLRHGLEKFHAFQYFTSSPPSQVFLYCVDYIFSILFFFWRYHQCLRHEEMLSWLFRIRKLFFKYRCNLPICT